eukprot:1144688-Pelagomonas_calceolata.AAC.2
MRPMACIYLTLIWQKIVTGAHDLIAFFLWVTKTGSKEQQHHQALVLSIAIHKNNVCKRGKERDPICVRLSEQLSQSKTALSILISLKGLAKVE